MTPDQASTFQAAAGTTPEQLSLLFRTVIGAILFAWATWMGTSFIAHLRSEHGSVGEIIGGLFRVGIVVMLGLLLIAYR